VVLSKDGTVLSDEALLLAFHDGGLASLVFFLDALLLNLELSLSAIDGELLLPKSFDLAFVFKLTHPSLLSVHLLKTLILGELGHEFVLELILHSSLLGNAFFLKVLLIGLGIKEVLLDSLALLNFLALSLSCLLFKFLHVELISQVLDIFVLSATPFLFRLKLLEDPLSCSLSFSLLGFNLSLTTLLLLSIAAEHLVFIGLELHLLALEFSLFVDRLNHVKLGLLLLHADEGDHLLILLDHLGDNLINLTLFLHVLLEGLGTELGLHLHLALQVVLLLKSEACALLLLLSLDEVLEFLVSKHLLLHLSVDLLFK